MLNLKSNYSYTKLLVFSISFEMPQLHGDALGLGIAAR